MTADGKRMKNNQDAVTANPLGCGSLWNKKQQTTTANGTGLPRKHFVFSRKDDNGNKLPRMITLIYNFIPIQ